MRSRLWAWWLATAVLLTVTVVFAVLAWRAR